MNYVIADRRSKSGAVITCRAKVNPAEHTGVLDLVQRGGKAREAPHHPRHSVRRYAARRVFAQPRTKDLRRRSAHARVADGYSGKGGVVKSGVQFGSAAVLGFPSFAAC
jgi:hypothetical protein